MNKFRLPLDGEKRTEKKVTREKAVPFPSFGSFTMDRKEGKWTDRTPSNWWKFFRPKVGRKGRKLVRRQKVFLIWHFCPLKADTKIYYSQYILKFICKTTDSSFSQLLLSILPTGFTWLSSVQHPQFNNRYFFDSISSFFLSLLNLL